MLDRPSREPETPHDPYAWVDAGERWVKEPRRAAPALDAFLTHAHRLGAEQVMFSTFQPASFRLWGRNRKVTTRDPLDENDASMIVNHLYGADGMARLQGGGDINVMYQIGSPRKGTLRFRCNVTAITASRGAGANVVIRPVRDLPQPLDEQNVEPEILAHYRMTKGMMIVSGATGSGKSTLIGAMTVEKLRDPDAHRNIIECAEPVEFLLDRVESVTSTISQSEIPAQREELRGLHGGGDAPPADRHHHRRVPQARTYDRDHPGGDLGPRDGDDDPRGNRAADHAARREPPSARPTQRRDDLVRAGAEARHQPAAGQIEGRQVDAVARVPGLRRALSQAAGVRPRRRLAADHRRGGG